MLFCIAKERVKMVMNKYFAMRTAPAYAAQISHAQIDAYRKLVVREMKKMGATEQELLLLHDITVANSIMNKREPRDVAWALLQ